MNFRLRAKGIAKSFETASGALPVLEGIDVEVGAGELVCIVGPSGCGKSTLLRILAGLEQTDAGEFEFGDNYPRTAFVQQNPNLLPWRTVLQNALLGLELHGKPTLEDILQIRQQLKRFGLGEFENALPEDISGGMTQKAALACALATRPTVLFCDEPFSAIDFVGRLPVMSEFREACRALGMAVLLVTHNIEEAILLGDRILVLTGRPAKLTASFSVPERAQLAGPVDFHTDAHRTNLLSSIWKVLNGED